VLENLLFIIIDRPFNPFTLLPALTNSSFFALMVKNGNAMNSADYF